MTQKEREAVLAVLRRDVAGYEEAARRRGLNPEDVGLIRILRKALAKEEARKG